MSDQPGETQPKSDIDLSGYLSNVPTAQTGWRAIKYYREGTNPKIVQWVIRYSGGLVKDERQATYVLLGFVVVALAAAFFLLVFGGTGQVKPFPPPPSPATFSR